MGDLPINMRLMTHSDLARQLKVLGLDSDRPPADLAVWQELLDGVSDHYKTLAEDTHRSEEALVESNSEMRLLEKTIAKLEEDTSGHSQEHYQSLFESTPVPTWEENFHEVALWLEGLRASGVDDLEQHLENNPSDLRAGVSLIQRTNVNRAAVRFLGAGDVDEALGPISIDDDSAPAFAAQFMAIWNGEDSVRSPLVGKAHDGTSFDGIVEWHAPSVFGSPSYARVLVTIVDISEQKAAERQARERLKTKDEYIASISHELRTPLTSVLGYAELLRSMDEGDYEEERDSLLAVISNQATDLSDLVEDLLVTARAELGELSVVAVPVNIHAQIAQVLESRSAVADRPKVSPRPGESAMALGDPHRVRQILRNLITNATRYGGPEIVVEVESSGDVVTVKVLDNGDGLAPGDEDQMFKRYARSAGAEAGPDSVGLGLTIARDLAEKMGGDLAYSRVDDWTCFALSLPVFVE